MQTPLVTQEVPGTGRGCAHTGANGAHQPATFALCRQAQNRTANLKGLNPCHSEPLLQQGSARLCAPEVPANAHKLSFMHSSSALLPAGEAGTSGDRRHGVCQCVGRRRPGGAAQAAGLTRRA